MAELYKKLGQPSTERMQHMLANGDLFEILGDNAHLLSQVDRSAFRVLFAPPPKSIDWTPVSQYADKLRDWNQRFRLGLSEEQISGLVLPNHAGPHQPTGISLTLGNGLKGDRKIVQEILKYELSKLGVAFTDYIGKNDRSVKYHQGSEPEKGKKPQLGVALLDLGRFWDPQNGVIVREVRQQLADQRLPGLEVDWLMALNAQVFARIDYETMPGLLAPGLVVDPGGSVPVFDRDSEGAYVLGDRDDYRWRDYSVVAFREC